MIRVVIWYIILVCISVTLISCSDNPSSIGAGLLKNDYVSVKSLDSYSDSLAQTSSYFKREVPLGSSPLLLLGKSANVQSSILIRFLVIIPDSIVQDYHDNQLTVKSASIEMTKYYSFGDNNASLDFTVNKVNNPWASDRVVGSSPDTMMIDPADISSNRIITDSLTTFNIDPQIALSWIKATADTDQALNSGIMIKPSTGSQKVIGYESVNFLSGNYPVAKVVIKLKNGVIDTLSFTTSQDASVVTGTLPSLSPDEIAVQSGLIVNSKLWFDVSKIPSNAIINSAILTLTEDTTNTITGSNYADALSAISLVDSTLLDSTNMVSIQLVKSDNQFSGDISTFVHQWIKTGNNQGMVLGAYSQLSGFELFALKGSNSSNAALRPRLQITYTIKK